MIYILLPVHNRKKFTLRFVKKLKLQSYSNFHLILIDDGSTDGTAQVIGEILLPNQLTILIGDGNLWWAGGLQKGYEYLRLNQKIKESDLILIVNDDTFFEEHAFEKAVKKLKDKEKTLLLAKNIDENDPNLTEGGIHANWLRGNFTKTNDPEKINCLSTRGLFFKWKDFKEIGGFKPDLLPHYTSDYEFTIRAFNKGFKLIVNDDIKLYWNSQATGILALNNNLSYRDFLAQVFSERSHGNPIRFSIFIILSAPWYFIPHNLLRIWLQFIKDNFSFFLNKSTLNKKK